jgi:hypothetical protein
MIVSNDELLYNAAWDGDIKQIEELLSKSARIGYKDEVRKVFVV